MARARSGGAGSSKRGSGGASDLRDALAQLIDPRSAIVLTRERLEDALQDAVSRGRVTADDAQELVASLFERGRRQTQEVIGELEKLLAAKAGRARRGASSGARRSSAGAARPAGSARRGVPIAGYDDLNVAEVRKRLGGLSPAQLRAVRDHERAHAKRKTVLEAIERKLKSK